MTVALALLTTLALSASPVAQDEPVELAERIVEILQAEAGPGWKAEQIARLGPGTVDLSFAFCAGERDELRSLTAGRREALLRVVELRPIAELRTTLATREPAELTPDAARTAVEFVRRAGREKELSLVLGLLSDGETDPRAMRTARAVLESCVLAVLERRSGTLFNLQDGFAQYAPELLDPIIRAISKSEHPERITALARLLNRVPEADSLLLHAIERTAKAWPAGADDYARSAVRVYLDRFDPNLVQLASRAAGALEDYAAIPALMDLVDGEDPHQAEAAADGLREISGLRLRTSIKVWEHWYSRELVWWSESAPDLLASLPHLEAPELAAALRQIGKRRLYRHELAEALVNNLDDAKRPQLVQLAAAALGRLGSRRSLGPLIDLLDDPNLAVREAAQDALERITGEELGASSDSWLHWLEESGA